MEKLQLICFWNKWKKNSGISYYIILNYSLSILTFRNIQFKSVSLTVATVLVVFLTVPRPSFIVLSCPHTFHESWRIERFFESEIRECELRNFHNSSSHPFASFSRRGLSGFFCFRLIPDKNMNYRQRRARSYSYTLRLARHFHSAIVFVCLIVVHSTCSTGPALRSSQCPSDSRRLEFKISTSRQHGNSRAWAGSLESWIFAKKRVL